MEKLSEAAIQKELAGISGWEYLDGALATTFEFQDFKEAFAVMTRIAFECEALQHHPDWNNVYNRLDIRLQTHDAGGVTQKDFELARAIDNLVLEEPETD